MSSAAITVGELVQIVGLVSAILALWWRVETRISRGAVEAMAHSTATAKALTDFKLYVAEHYVKSGLLKEVEERLIERFDAMVEELHGMREDFHKAMINRAVRATRQRRKSS